MNQFHNQLVTYIIYLLITFICFINFVTEVNGAKFQKIKKLSSSGDYFVILDNGLFIYNSNFTENLTIYSFNDIQKISNNEDSINVIISELKNNDDIYIICLVKKYLYLYDDSNKKIYNYYLSDLSSKSDYCQSGVIYNLMPYNIQNNQLYFIISLINEQFAANKIIFLYYNYNYLENTINIKEQSYKGTEALFRLSTISPYYISCQIYSYSSNIVQCLYSRYYQEIFNSIYFNLNINDIQNAKQFDITDELGKNYVQTIDSSISKDNNIFTAFLGSDNKCHIFINNSDYTFIEISCAQNYICQDFETFYFSETNEFVLICRKNNIFKLLIFNSKDSQVIKTNNCNSINFITKQLTINDCNAINIYSLIYNDSTSDYNIITDCNFTNNPKTDTSEDLKPTIVENEEDISTNIINLNHSDSNNITLNINKEDLENLINGLKDPNDTIFQNFIDQLVSKSDIILAFIEKTNITQNLTTDKAIYLIENLLNNTPCELNIDNQIKLDITESNSTIPKNSTRIDLGECGNILKQHYNLTNLDFFKVAVISLNTNNQNSLHDQVEYKVYNDKNKELDLSLCKNETIMVYYSINKNASIDLDLLKYYKDLNIDVLNSKDTFFNDICYPYSESGDDIVLGDRRNDIYQNYSLCDEGCKYDNIDYENMVISCKCKIKENITTEIMPLNYEEFEEVSLIDSNIGVIVCYQLVFSFKGKLNNIGFWLLTIFFIGNMVPLICYFYHGIKPIMEYIFYEMVQYGYLKKNHKMFFEEKSGTKISKKNKKNVIKKDTIKNKIKKKNKNISNPIKNSRIKRTKNTINKKNKNGVLIRDKKIINNNKNINFSQDNQDSLSIQKINENKKPIFKEIKKKHNIHKLYKNKKNNNLSYLSTENISQNNKNINKYGIIKLDLNNIQNYIPKDSNETLYNYTFKEAIEYDKRSLFKIFYIYLLSKQIIFHTFFLKSPLELFTLRLCLFIFMISTDLALNALLYLNDNISKKYKYSKSLFLFTFSDNITVIIYSTLLCFVLMTLINKLGSSANAIREVFSKEEEKIKNNKKYKINVKRKNEIFLEIEKILKRFKIKIIILIIIQNVLMLFFWYFVTAFCHVYYATQKSWLLDSGLSILSRWVIELLFALFFSKLYLVSIESNVYTLYRIILFIYGFR